MSRIDSDVPGQASLDYEAWRDLVRTMGGRFNPEGVDPMTFTGWVRPLNVCDFIAAEVGSNTPRLERTIATSASMVTKGEAEPIGNLSVPPPPQTDF
jgi:hypothetical protein